MLRMMNTPSAIPLSKKEPQPPSAFCKVARGVFTTCSSRTVNVNIPATPPNCLFSPSSTIGKLCMDCSFWKVAKMLLVDRMRREVALNCSLKDIRNTYDRYMMIYIYIYENCTVQLAGVGLAQARPNYITYNPFTPSYVHKLITYEHQ